MSDGCFCYATVQTSEVGILERCGKFNGLANPGIVCLAWPCERIAGRVSTRLIESKISCRAKTKDNVFVTIALSIQYKIANNDSYTAYYRSQNPEEQLKSYVYDAVRCQIPLMNLDETFVAKDTISDAVLHSLAEPMASLGYEVVKALVTDLDPAREVQLAMDEINTAKRGVEANKNKGESLKVLSIKNAEAKSESTYLSGVGMSRQRAALMDGLQSSLVEFEKLDLDGMNSKDVLSMLMVTQYFDTLKDIGESDKSEITLLPLAQSNDLAAQIRDGALQANAGTKGIRDGASRAAPNATTGSRLATLFGLEEAQVNAALSSAQQSQQRMVQPPAQNMMNRQQAVACNHAAFVSMARGRNITRGNCPQCGVFVQIPGPIW